MNRIMRSVVLPADTSDVWESMTDPDRLGAWLGGDLEFTAEVGAALSFVDDTEHRHGFVVDIIRHHRIELWWSTDRGRPSTVTIELESVEDGTMVTITEELAAVAASASIPTFTRQAGFGNRPLAVVR